MGRLTVGREVGIVDDAVVGIVGPVVGTVMIVIVGRVIVGEVVGDELGLDDELVDELAVDVELVDVGLVEVDPVWERVPIPAVTRLFRSTVTSGNWTILVAGIVLGS